ncbi:MAG: thioesterase family protein [Pseudomonadota bacterium]
MIHESPITHEIEHTVGFYELDPMQIVWHGNYFKYFEDARAGLFKRRGIDLFEFYGRTNYLFPIIKTATKHIAPLRYGDAFICKAAVIEAKAKIVIDFEIRLKADGQLCARGRTEQAAVKLPGMEIEFTIPGEIQKALGM